MPLHKKLPSEPDILLPLYISARQMASIDENSPEWKQSRDIRKRVLAKQAEHTKQLREIEEKYSKQESTLQGKLDVLKTERQAANLPASKIMDIDIEIQRTRRQLDALRAQKYRSEESLKENLK
jgi:hypothetical protein